MASTNVTSSNLANPFQQLDPGAPERKPKEELIKQASSILADTMARLAPDGGYSINDSNLKYMADHGQFKDNNGKLVKLTDEEQKAASILTSHGGITSIDDDQNGLISEGDFRRVAEHGSSKETTAVHDFTKWMNSV